MKLDYNILWIDDTPKWVQSIEGSLKDHCDGLGFRLNIALERNGANIAEAIRNPELDLIIVDFQLPKVTGKELIETIRKKHVLIEIVFYSQSGNPKDKFETPPDGVYFTSREDAEERILAVIDLTLKKTQDINNIRGLVIAETIDIEAKLNEVLVHCFGDQGVLFRDRLLDPEFGLFDFGKKDKLLQGILKDRIKELNKKASDGNGTEKEAKILAALKELKSVYTLFPVEVIHPRNTMAHVEKQWDEHGQCILRSHLKGHDAIYVDHEWCMRARKNLIKHMDNLESILKTI
ncbi:MAG TPA: response regulator [Candidatus Sulfotelmatobacter sp.]|nr:response regulator [Candidatus Sulfotelmatobacter sp.]